MRLSSGCTLNWLGGQTAVRNDEVAALRATRQMHHSMAVVSTHASGRREASPDWLKHTAVSKVSLHRKSTRGASCNTTV